MKDFEPRGEALEKLGFERVGVSDFYVQGLFAVELSSKKTSLFVDYEDMNWSDVISLKAAKKFDSFALEILASDGKYRLHTVGGSGTSTGKPELVKEINERVGMEVQLKEAGFKTDRKEKNLYRKVIREYGERIELVAIAENGVLRKVLKPIREEAREIIGKNFEVVGFRNDISEWGSPFSVITLKNDSMQFGVSSTVGGMLVEGSQKLIRRITEEELGIRDLKVVTERSGFKIGGVNPTDKIRNLDRLAKQSIDELEKRMRPNNDSMAGFLGQNEKLLDVLAADNDFVLSQALTHQDLAKPLIYAREHYNKERGGEFTYGGSRFKIEAVVYRGIQHSPFDDETLTNMDMKVENLDTGAVLSCSGLLPDMVQRYGFYEGRGTSYRLDPTEIIRVFDFLQK